MTVMVDWLKMELPDCWGQFVTGGAVQKISSEGEIEWTSFSKRRLEGSYSSSVFVRNRCTDGTGFEIDGNPAKFLSGHNLFGSADPVALAERMFRKVASVLDLPDSDIGPIGSGKIGRIDITGSFLVDRAEDVIPYLAAFQERVFCPYRGRGKFADGDPGTIYYGMAEKGGRAKAWALKIYAKGREVAKRPLPAPAYLIPGLLDEVNRTIRFELTLRTEELKRLNLCDLNNVDAGDPAYHDLKKETLQYLRNWNADTAQIIWDKYFGKLPIGEVSMASAYEIETEDGKPKLTARHLDALASWQAGNDLRQGRSRSAWYSLHKTLLAYGHDIALDPPKSNVVPLRRVIEAKSAHLPNWADQLTAALRAA